MKHMYLIDYENVHFSGLERCEDLKENDEIHLFFSNSCECIKIDFLYQIQKLGVKLKLHQLKKKGKNALDFQLTSFLGVLAEKNSKNKVEIIVVSNDKGYDSAIQFLQELYSEKLVIKKKVVKVKKELGTSKEQPSKKEKEHSLDVELEKELLSILDLKHCPKEKRNSVCDEIAKCLKKCQANQYKNMAYRGIMKIMGNKNKEGELFYKDNCKIISNQYKKINEKEK